MYIRSFENSDWSEIVGIYEMSKLDELVNENKNFALLPLEEDKKRLKELQESDIYVYDNNGIKGYGAIYKSEIRSLFVHPEYRGVGIGGKLLKHLLTLIKSPAYLYVAKSNSEAKSIYKKYGFKVTQEFKTTYNGEPVFANKMERHR